MNVNIDILRGIVLLSRLVAGLRIRTVLLFKKLRSKQSTVTETSFIMNMFLGVG